MRLFFGQAHHVRAEGLRSESTREGGFDQVEVDVSAPGGGIKIYTAGERFFKT